MLKDHAITVLQAIYHVGQKYQRKRAWAALISTVLVFIVLILRRSIDADTLLTTYQLPVDTVLVAYAALIVVMGLAVVVEPTIRRELSDGKSTGAIVVIAGCLSFILTRPLIPDQGFRLSSYPFSLWLVIVHLIALLIVVVTYACSAPDQAPSRRIQRYAILVLIVLGLGLAFLHVASVGRFMRLDFPDEAELASLATSYAERGVLDRSYMASTFGIPDPVAPRYYALMGLWLRAVGISLVTLRVFALLVAAAAVLIVGFVLCRDSSLTLAQRLGGLVIMIASSVFVRTSHDIRQDIGLSVYGALVLAGLFFYFQRSDGQKKWLLLSGAALLVGLESIPVPSLIFAGVVGIIILMQDGFRAWRGGNRWRDLAVYGAGCTFAVAIYAAVRLLPDPAANLDRFLRYNQYYRAFNARSASLFDQLLSNARYSAALSPIELGLILAAIVLAIRSGSRTARLLTAALSIGMVAVPLFGGRSFAYLTLFTPFLAYAAAQALQSQRAVLIGVFVLIPALVAPPMADLAADIKANGNYFEIAEADLLTWQIPPGTTVVANDIFWFTLRPGRRFIGWGGVGIYAQENHIPIDEAFKQLGVDIAICFEPNKDICELVNPTLFEPPTNFVVTRGKYLVYQRKK